MKTLLQIREKLEEYEKQYETYDEKLQDAIDDRNAKRADKYDELCAKVTEKIELLKWVLKD